MMNGLVNKLLVGKTLTSFNNAGDNFQIDEIISIDDEKKELTVKGTLFYYRGEDSHSRHEDETITIPFDIPWNRLLEASQ